MFPQGENGSRTQTQADTQDQGQGNDVTDPDLGEGGDLLNLLSGQEARLPKRRGDLNQGLRTRIAARRASTPGCLCLLSCSTQQTDVIILPP